MMSNKNNNCKNGIYGLAIGDALGVPVEFLTRDYLTKNPVQDFMEDKVNELPKGTWSDDTSMTIATMDSINDKHSIDIEDMILKFISWMDNAEYTATGECFDIGNTVFSALIKYKNAPQMNMTYGENSLNSNGNGSLMRILPISYYINKCGIKDESTILKIVKDVSSITHSHEISILSCYIYVLFSNQLLNGIDRNEAYKYIQSVDYSSFKPENIHAFDKILKSDIRTLKEAEIKSTGYTVDTLEAAIWIFMNSRNYNESILKAVNLGDDSDTVGAVAGGLLGIEYGIEAINPRWIEELQNIQLLNSICEKFNQLHFENRNTNNEDYKSKLEIKYLELSREILNSINANKPQKRNNNNQIDFEK